MTPEEIIKQTQGNISAPCSVRIPLSLPIQVLSYGTELVTGHTYRHALATRDPVPYISFQYTLDGCGAFYQHGKQYDLPPGSAFITRHPAPCIYEQHPDSDLYHLLFVDVRGEGAMSLGDQIIEHYGNVITLSNGSKSIRMLCQHINELRASNAPFDFYGESLFMYDFLLTLWREISPKGNQETEQIPEAIERATEYLEKHLANPLLDVSDLAKVANFSRCYFTRLFQKFYGTSPRKYLLARRLNAAMQILINDKGYHLKEVIEQCGFTSETYFCHAFRKMYKEAPGDVRKRFFSDKSK